jgi:hypothetical protein
MTPMGVPVTVHMVVHVLIMVAEIIRRRKFIPTKTSLHAVVKNNNTGLRPPRQEKIQGPSSEAVIKTVLTWISDGI